MPVSPPIFRPPGAPSRAEQRRVYDARRTELHPWRAWYWTPRWRARSKAQLLLEPLCRMCKAEGVITAAKVADHVEQHHGDPVKFWDGELQSLCKWHHDSVKRAEENAASMSG